jgi:hypothetical protein
MKSYRGSGDIAPPILKHDTRLRWVVSFRVALPQWKETQDAPLWVPNLSGGFWEEKYVFIAWNRTPDITYNWLNYFIFILSFHLLVYLFCFYTRRRRVNVSQDAERRWSVGVDVASYNMADGFLVAYDNHQGNDHEFCLKIPAYSTS